MPGACRISAIIVSMARMCGSPFWQELAASAGPGDAFTVTAGCDKSFEMCRSRFSNAVNFRGFPHMPGTDRALAYAGNGGEMDGGSLFR